MKKMWFVLCALLLLCGCEKSRPEYLVSAIGVDSKNGEYEVCFEAVVVNSETAEQNLKLFRGRGKSLLKATQKIEKYCTQPLLLSHCGVIVVGDGVGKDQYEEIKEYCYNTDPITLSAYFIRTENAKKLLSIKPVSSVSVGYDIMGQIRQNKNYKNRFFEVLNHENTSLPKISVRDGGLYFGTDK